MDVVALARGASSTSSSETEIASPGDDAVDAVAAAGIEATPALKRAGARHAGAAAGVARAVGWEASKVAAVPPSATTAVTPGR
jgi:hypothetical protein